MVYDKDLRHEYYLYNLWLSCHFNHFRPLGVGNHNNKEHAALEWTCKIDMDPDSRRVGPQPGMHWYFGRRIFYCSARKTQWSDILDVFVEAIIRHTQIQFTLYRYRLTGILLVDEGRVAYAGNTFLLVSSKIIERAAPVSISIQRSFPFARTSISIGPEVLSKQVKFVRGSTMALICIVCGLFFRCIPLTGYTFHVMPLLRAETALTSSLGPRSAHCRDVAFLPTKCGT